MVHADSAAEQQFCALGLGCVSRVQLDLLPSTAAAIVCIATPATTFHTHKKKLSLSCWGIFYIHICETLCCQQFSGH